MRHRFLLLVIILLGLLAVGCGAKPAAVINGEEISEERFDRYFTQLKSYAEQMGTSFEGDDGKQKLNDLKQSAMDGLIYETLILQSGKKEGIEVTDKEVNGFLDQQVKGSFETEEKYQEWLDSMKMTEKEFRQKIEYQLTGQKLFDKVTERINITDEEARKFYESDKTLWEKIKVSHILISVERDTASKTDLAEAKEKALSVIRELDQGANFADLAKEYSGDPGSASLGGVLDMEFARNDQGLVHEFVEGSFLLDKVGDYSKEPVLSQFGYHIIKLDAKKGSFEDVKADVKNQLVQTEKNKTFDKYMENLNKEAKITKNIPLE
ncbi:MAG: SurA N-terminal domain-containing protein [Dehalobacterium sp.]